MQRFIRHKGFLKFFLHMAFNVGQQNGLEGANKDGIITRKINPGRTADMGKQ